MLIIPSVLLVLPCMILLEAWRKAQMHVAVIACVLAPPALYRLSAAVYAVGYSAAERGVVRMGRPASMRWTSVLLVVALGRVGCCELVHELDAEVQV